MLHWDTFPNGGCTTTCEALWMGVPVVTLTGDNYVGRAMSTAVLNGADMSDWCATSSEEYIQICVNQSDSLSSLRQMRDHWRYKLQSNPLGNATDLMSNLELAFTKMVSLKTLLTNELTKHSISFASRLLSQSGVVFYLIA